MATIASKFSSNQLATPTSPCFGQPVVQDLFIDVTAAQLLLNNVFDLGILPAGHTVTGAVLLPGDLDSNGTPLLALDIGIMSGTPGDVTSVRTCGSELFAADATARAAGGVTRMTQQSGFTILATGADRSIGVKVQAAPATAAAGRIRLRLEMHASDTTVQF
jgi:hypothetical protein